MSHSVRRHLRVDVDAYDQSIRRFIPAYEEMLEQAASAVAEARPECVLDLGAGTGALTEALLQRYPHCSVELIDSDGTMLEQARKRLAPFASRLRYTERSFHGPLPPCDAVIASLALHHVPTLEGKQDVFRSIHAALRPGGVFVNADATMSADPQARQTEYQTWAAHLVASGISEERAWGHFKEWADEDTYFPLEEELARLRAAGFEAACLWHTVPIKVVRGVKPAVQPDLRQGDQG